MLSGAVSATSWPIQRSVLDRPVLADTTDPVVAAFAVAYDEAVETLGECTPSHPRCAARALSAAHAAEYAASLADQHARRLARHGIYPHLRGPLDGRGLDLIEEARTSLELAAHAWPAQAATRHCYRAAQLAEEVGIRCLTCSPRPGKRCLTSPRR